MDLKIQNSKILNVSALSASSPYLRVVSNKLVLKKYNFFKIIYACNALLVDTQEYVLYQSNMYLIFYSFVSHSSLATSNPSHSERRATYIYIPISSDIYERLDNFNLQVDMICYSSGSSHEPHDLVNLLPIGLGVLVSHMTKLTYSP